MYKRYRNGTIDPHVYTTIKAAAIPKTRRSSRNMDRDGVVEADVNGAIVGRNVLDGATVGGLVGAWVCSDGGAVVQYRKFSSFQVFSK
mmetsp:Transcript_15265/g.37484  ORF Transcript_15265/g.37484 Transcript_15265/m.37484 type:complete len:88 (-) Transcript_15265:589-852(-)